MSEFISSCLCLARTRSGLAKHIPSCSPSRISVPAPCCTASPSLCCTSHLQQCCISSQKLKFTNKKLKSLTFLEMWLICCVVLIRARINNTKKNHVLDSGQWDTQVICNFVRFLSKYKKRLFVINIFLLSHQFLHEVILENVIQVFNCLRVIYDEI